MTLKIHALMQNPPDFDRFTANPIEQIMTQHMIQSTALDKVITAPACYRVGIG